jgi:P4 family phage/plasmid primase-like protien
LQWDYAPDAGCPEWKGFLGEVLTDPETVEYVQRLAGYCLTGDVSEHAVVFCYGRGANGKSVLLNALLTLLGDYATQAPTSMLVSSQGERHPTELITLHGRRFVVCAEVPGGKAWNEELIKSISGGDPISARGMREDFWTFQPTHKLLRSGNHKPFVRGQDEGIWRRWHLLPFERTIPVPERDRKLPERLAAEMPGILAWAVQGALTWQRDGLKPSAKVLAATSAYRTESDRLAPFIEERCTLDGHGITSRASLYRAYLTWSGEQGERHPLSTRTFSELVRGKGVAECWTRENGKRCQGWRGIELAGNSSNSSTPDSPLDSRIHFSREEVLPSVAGAQGKDRRSMRNASQEEVSHD